MSFRKTPWLMTVKWRRGLSWLACCKKTGMLMMGVTAPEIRMQGTPTVKAPRKACCWVEDREETISPTPPEATAKISMAR